MKIYREKHEMNEEEITCGVVYAAAAEQVINEQFENYFFEKKPAVIGYIVRNESVVSGMVNDCEAYHLDMGWCSVHTQRFPCDGVQLRGDKT